MKNSVTKHKHVLQLIAAVVVVVLLMMLLKDRSVFSQWEHLVTDALFVQSTPPKQITVAGIDEKSLSEIGAWPWNREVFARFIQKLESAGVRVAAFDVTLFESREGDAELSQVLQASTMQVVLAGKVEGDQMLRPESQLLNSPNVHTGFANLFTDADGKVRQTQLILNPGDGDHPSFAYRALLSYLGRNNEIDYSKVNALGFTQLPADGNIVVNYLGQRGTVNTVSFADILDGSYDVSKLKDQLVFVGSTVQDLKFGLDDNLITPTGIMPGVEIHANIAATVINNNVIYPVAMSVSDLVLILLAAGALLLIILIPYWIAAVIIIVTDIIYLIVMVALFGGGHLGDFLYTPLTLFIIVIVGLGWRYLGKYIESLGLRRAFSQYVNEQLLGEILRDPSKLKLGGERRDMTVFFSDIRGFTTISERMDAEKLVEFLNVYLTKATDVILENRGVVDKYLGDAIMALWNAPLLDEHHALNASMSGLAILDVLADFNQNSGYDIPELKIGIGINTGEMVVGNMGSLRRFDYTVMGDNVNLASRLEGMTKKYHCAIILGEGVVQDLESNGDAKHLIYRWIDTVTVKGKEKPVKLYELMGLSAAENAGKLQQLKQEFEIAVQEYTEGSFISAEEKFSHLSREYHDEVAQMMAERCTDLEKSTEEWKGYWAWDSK